MMHDRAEQVTRWWLLHPDSTLNKALNQNLKKEILDFAYGFELFPFAPSSKERMVDLSELAGASGKTAQKHSQSTAFTNNEDKTDSENTSKNRKLDQIDQEVEQVREQLHSL